MKKRGWSKSGATLLVIAGFLLVGVAVSFALPIRGETLTDAWEQGVGGETFYGGLLTGWQTHYEIAAGELCGDWQTSFCVEKRPIDVNSDLTIDYDFSGNDLTVAQLGAFYLSGTAAGKYSRSDFRSAIWSIHDIGYYHSYFGNLGGASLTGDRYRLRTRSRSGSAVASISNGPRQLVHVSEPETMFLLGIGMVGLGLVGRKKVLKKYSD
jgi:hypothetical protein